MALSVEPGTTRGRDGRLAQPARHRRVLLVSNRLPATVHLREGGVRLLPSTGGVATGLRPVHATSSRPWIGWSGLPAGISAPAQREIDARLAEIGARQVPLSDADIAGYYRRFANGVLWPLLHGREPDIAPDARDYETYRSVNARFAEVVLRELRPGDRVWIHDYQLLLLPRLLRERRPDVRVGFFLHTPFPEPEALASLPQAAALLDGILGADVVGLHIRAYVDRFAGAVRGILGRYTELASGAGVVDDEGRAVGLHATPMGVDVAGLAALAADPGIGRRVAALRASGGPLFVAVDRLDPTKGIPQRLESFGRLLELRPELRGRARLIQIAAPSREEVPAYRALRARVATMVSELNARFGTPAWRPVEYTYGSVREPELVAMYRAADVMVVTPLCDGMNLVAKEFVATRTDEDGALLLSRHAGAAGELTAAMLVDPENVAALAHSYGVALEMSPAERRVRMRRLLAKVRGHDVHRWAAECLHHLDGGVRMTRHTAS